MIAEGLGGKLVQLWHRHIAALVIGGIVFASSPKAEALQCVPFARETSGISIRGDAWTWWSAAAGQYERGHDPRVGAVVVFKKFSAMRYGHVAVVARVVNSREVLVDHANWAPHRGHGRGKISKMVAVTDVSPNNDWTEVRVWNSATRDFGTRTYPTYGFIYPLSKRGYVQNASLSGDQAGGQRAIDDAGTTGQQIAAALVAECLPDEGDGPDKLAVPISAPSAALPGNGAGAGRITARGLVEAALARIVPPAAAATLDTPAPLTGPVGPETKVAQAAEAKPQPAPEARTLQAAETKAQPAPEVKTPQPAEARPQPMPEVKVAQASEAKPQPMPEVKAAPPAEAHGPEIKLAAPEVKPAEAEVRPAEVKSPVAEVRPSVADVKGPQPEVRTAAMDAKAPAAVEMKLASNEARPSAGQVRQQSPEAQAGTTDSVWDGDQAAARKVGSGHY